MSSELCHYSLFGTFDDDLLLATFFAEESGDCCEELSLDWLPGSNLASNSVTCSVLLSLPLYGPFALGHMDGSIRELIILGRLGLTGHPPPPKTVTVIHWKPPQSGWYKVNVDGSAPYSPGHIFVGVIFRYSRGFFITAFAKAVGWGYPFEAELAVILHAIIFAFEHGWFSLWVESDSTLAIQTLQGSISIILWQLQGL
ncbi:hypothetical protein ACS0TY_034249 [Phlomoides rotata]